MHEITTVTQQQAQVSLVPVEGSDVYCQPHAFAHTTLHSVAPHGATVREIIRSLELPPLYDQYIDVYVDDARIPMEWWNKVRPKRGAAVYVRVTAHGGGGGKTLRTIAVIAIVVASIATGQVYGAQAGAAMGLTGATATAVGTAVVTVGVQLVGNLALNALIPPQQPTSPDAGSSAVSPPRYQLTGTQNRLEPYANIPRIFGQRRVYPMHAAHPYTEVVGNDEYLRVLLCVGWGPLEITDVRIGETPIENFQGVELEFRYGWPDDEPIKLFSNSVTEQAVGALLDDSTTWVTRTTLANCSELMVDFVFPGGLALFNDDGVRVNASVGFEIQYRLAGAGNSWISPDFEPNYDGSVQNGGRVTVTAADSSAVRASARWRPNYSDENTAYEIRVRRTTNPLGTRYVDESYFSVIRMVRNVAPVKQSGLAMLAIRMKASGQLNGTPSTINCVAKSWLPVYDPNTSTWSYQSTVNPAWAFCDILRRRGNETYLSDDRIDIPAIVDWANACATPAPNSNEPRWSFNGVIEGGSIFTALKTITAHARANFTMRHGRYSVVRDVEQSTPVQHISPRNSWGYAGHKTFIDHPHALRVRFVNAAQGYQEDEQIVYADGYNAANATKYETVELAACTSATQAWREGRYMLASGALRPEEHTVSMDIEALRCEVGDLVRFSHDAIDIGLISTRIVSLDTINPAYAGSYYDAVTLEDTVEFVAGRSYVIRVRNVFGESTLYSVYSAAIGVSTQLRFTVPVATSTAPQAGDLVMLGEATRETAPMIVKKIVAGPNLTAKLSLVDAQPGIYTADTGTIPVFNSYISKQTPVKQLQPSIPVLLEMRSDETALLRLTDGTLQDRIALSINPPAASVTSVESYETYWRAAGEKSWNVTKNTRDTTLYLTPVLAGSVYEIKVRAVSHEGVASDFTAVVSHTVVGKTTPPTAPATATASILTDSVLLEWSPVTDVDLKEYEVRYGSSWDSAQFVTRGRSTSAKVRAPSVGTQTWLVKAIDVVGIYSLSATSVSLTITGPFAPVVSSSFDGDQVLLKWNAPSSPLAIDFYEVRYGSSFSTGTSLGTVKATTFAAKATFSSTRTYWIAAVDVNGNVGLSGSVEAVITPASAPTIRAQVVDNNVLLYWNEVRGSLPTETYEIRKGSSFSGGAVVGTKSGAFTTIFETVAGSYTYWIAAKDTAGNYGNAGSVAATVSQPPDYVLQLDSNTTFSGTKEAMAESGDGAWLLPVNTIETFQEHFVSRSWASPKDQVDAGYPFFIEPVPANGSYEETIDLGTVLPATKVTISVNGSTVSGTTLIIPKISLSTDGSTWTEYDNLSEVFSSGFRYVKYRILVAAADDKSLYRLAGINVRLDSKLKSDAGSGTSLSTDVGGTVVTLNVPFVDVAAIEVTPKGTTPLIAMYDFTDAPNPTTFKVLLFTTAGARASGDFSWSVKGY